MIWIEWVEPFGPASEPVYMRVAKATAIAAQRAAHPGAYARTPDGDELALEDFITVNWATVRDENACLSISPADPSGTCVESPRPSQGEKWGRLTEDEEHGLATLSTLPGVDSKQDDSAEANRSMGRLHQSENAQANRQSSGREAAEQTIPPLQIPD